MSNLELKSYRRWAVIYRCRRCEELFAGQHRLATHSTMSTTLQFTLMGKPVSAIASFPLTEPHVCVQGSMTGVGDL